MPRTKGIDDTNLESRRRMSALYARLTPEEKLLRVRDLTSAVSLLALAGLRHRHPAECESDLLLRLARIRLGDELVDAAYRNRAAHHGA